MILGNNFTTQICFNPFLYSYFLVCCDKIADLFTAIARLNNLNVIGLLLIVTADYDTMAT